MAFKKYVPAGKKAEAAASASAPKKKGFKLVDVDEYKKSEAKRAKDGIKPPTKPDFADAEKKSDSFPIVSVMDRRDMTRAIEIMTDDVLFAEQIEGLKAARAAMKTEIVELAKKYDLPGMRWGTFVVYARGMKTKTTLSTKKLRVKIAESDLPEDFLDDCYTESEPFADVRIVDMSKPKPKRKSADEEED